MNIFTLPQSAGGVLLGVAILLTAGFLMTRLTRRLYLPNVTGYILAGILVGPYALNLIPAWLSGCCFSRRMRKVCTKNEKFALQASIITL